MKNGKKTKAKVQKKGTQSQESKKPTARKAGRSSQSEGNQSQAADDGRVLRGSTKPDAAASLQEARTSTGIDVRDGTRQAEEHRRNEGGWASFIEGNERSDRGQGSDPNSILGPDGETDYDHDFARSEKALIEVVDYAVHLPEWHSKQKIFIESKHKRKIIRAGRRGGKTTGCAGLAVERFLGPDGTNRVLYAVPTAEQIARFWHEICLALAEPLEFGVFKKYEADKIIEYPGTEQRIRAKTAWNANTLRGDYGDLIILDEFQLMAEDALGDVVYPMLIDNNGDLVLIYTPPSVHTRATSKATDKRHAAKLFKKHEHDPRWLCLHFTSHDNPHISAQGIAEVSADMTQIAIRQEIFAEDSDEVPGALWKQAIIDKTRVSSHPELIRIVVGVDPPGGERTECGIAAGGLGTDGHGYFIEDASDLFETPRAWAAKATWVYYERKADRVLGEENYGGNMVETTLKIHDENISYRSVNATRGKLVRAEPICALYEKGFIHHVGTFAKLEEEMCSYVPGEKSPNRMDAMVWVFTELFPERVRLTLAQMKNQEQDAEVQKIEKAKELAKPVIPDNAGKCEKCGSPLLVKRGTVIHCNTCGYEVNSAATMPGQGGRAALLK